ncbi:MAG: ABC transporter ATP-binding protein [Sedimentisphaerales bacterium]|nr:ABC transporter ATP-binding protein [Sedimentisphaerales bacterium]
MMLLQLDQVTGSYASTSWRLGPVSFELGAGELLGIIGPNGAGKSTLLQIAAGIRRPDTGQVRLLDQPLSRLSRRAIARHLGYLPQQVASLFDYRVEQVVALGRYVHLRALGFMQPRDQKVVESCLARTETAAYRNRLLSELSGGERQRVLLASVLAQEPQILMLDEPTTGLDLHHQVRFFDLLAEQARRGLAVAVVTHDLNLAGLFCTRLLLLQDGLVVGQGQSHDLLEQDLLDRVYRGGVCVIRHPRFDRPQVLPCRPAASDGKQDEL